jgi:hypothetical protein
MRAWNDRPPLLVLGAPPRGGNHLLRGLLDGHPALLLPPDEDYAIRHLARSRLIRLRGALTPPGCAPAFYRGLQKAGHLERVNRGEAGETSGTEDSLDLDRYYDHLRVHHRPLRPSLLAAGHMEAMAQALGGETVPRRLRVYFCALQPSNRDLSRVAALLAPHYELRGLFVVRDPRAHLSSKLARNPNLNLRRYCRRQNLYIDEIERFNRRFGSAISLRFEDLVTDTESAMRRVCELAGIEFLPLLLDYTQGGQPAISNSSFDSSSGIDRGAVSRYRENLPQEVSAFVVRHCRAELIWEEGRAADCAAL